MTDTPKIYVLDTSVILYDFKAIYNFKENDVALPITVLEELDQFKKGNDILNLHAREFIRNLDNLSHNYMLSDWIPLHGESGGRLRVVMSETSSQDAGDIFGRRKNDHRILNVTLHLAENEPTRRVVLVSKDINLRLKARALNLPAEDYESVKIKDIASLYTGRSQLEVADPALVDRLYAQGAVPIADFLVVPPPCNHFFVVRSPSNSALATYNAGTKTLNRVEKRSVYGISPRNAEQTFAIHAILDPEIPLVSITGAAGTGKTLLALASALEQRRLYRQIYLARPIVPLSNKDIGFLPGDVASKIGPFMQPLWDNLALIKNQFEETDKEYKKIDELVQTEKLHITPLAYIRGRSFSKILFIVDEAQNLTPHEVKTIITRAGEGTKIVFTGDVFQIDTPYLDAYTNGLSYLVDRIRDNELYAHVVLEKGERSDLANLGNSLL
ncbi:MAG: PhoH family protein [Candidatus Schekmanbacteria bacterium]|nr:PhoH family protein [Candidatus Schekmanbacteria bacterium]